MGEKVEHCLRHAYCDNLQVLSGALRLLMQSNWESKEAPFGFPLFDHRKPLIYIKSTAGLRPVVHSQNSAEQESWRHVWAVHPSQVQWASRRSTISAGPSPQWAPTGRLRFTEPSPLNAACFPPHAQRSCQGVGVFLSLPPSPALPSFLSALHTHLKQVQAAFTLKSGWLCETAVSRAHRPYLFLSLTPSCMLTRKVALALFRKSKYYILI